MTNTTIIHNESIYQSKNRRKPMRFYKRKSTKTLLTSYVVRRVHLCFHNMRSKARICTFIIPAKNFGRILNQSNKKTNNAID